MLLTLICCSDQNELQILRRLVSIVCPLKAHVLEGSTYTSRTATEHVLEFSTDMSRIAAEHALESSTGTSRTVAERVLKRRAQLLQLTHT